MSRGSRSSNTGYVAGGDQYTGGIILKTIDAGITWTKTELTYALNSVYFPDSNTGFAVGFELTDSFNGIVLKTTDGGTTWNFQAKLDYNPLNSVFFNDAMTGYVAGENIAKTSDGGATWSGKYRGTGAYKSIYFPTHTTGYAVDDEGGIIKTYDGGNTWVSDSSGTRNRFTSVFFTDSITGYVVGDGGTILKTSHRRTDFIEEYKPSATNFTICPNPANTKITIIPAKGSLEEMQVIICTIKGEQVMNKQFRDQHQPEFDVSTLAKGIYLVKIQSKDGVEVKKLVID